MGRIIRFVSDGGKGGVFVVSAALFLSGCASPVPFETDEASIGGSGVSARAARPGLGTEWGDQERSEISDTTFTRGSRTRPTAKGKLFYNDAGGARAMAERTGGKKRIRASYDVAGGLLNVALVDGRDSVLPSYRTRSSSPIFVGESGDDYGIKATNTSSERIEVVFSVDGLDVIDGKPAGYSKRGYIIGPGRTTVIRGFRTSRSSVARFRFGSVRDSYAERKYGDSRNVGVIGFAVFAEKGTRPRPHSSGDTWLRQQADPFPGSRFATPP